MSGREALGGQLAVFEEPQTGDHQSVGLAGERCGQQRVLFRVACKTLRERDQFLPVLRLGPF